MSWEWWIKESLDLHSHSRYDLLCELAVNSYSLDRRSRKADLKDRLQFFILWWDDNNRKMKKYKTYTSIAKLIGIDHATVLHHLRKRKPTAMYKQNTKCINDFLNS